MAFLLLDLCPFVLFLKLILCPLCNSNTFRNILTVFGRNVEHDKTTCRYNNNNSAFLILALSPFVMFDSDYALIQCPRCKSNTLWNRFMIFSRNVEEDKTMCHVQELQLWHSYFWSHPLPPPPPPPFLCLNLSSWPLRNTNTLWNILMIFGRNVE